MNNGRFNFVVNLSRFLDMLIAERIERVRKSMCEYLGVDNLKGKQFLDEGSLSGLLVLQHEGWGQRYDQSIVIRNLENTL